MDKFPFYKRLFYRYLGIAYALTFFTSKRTILWIRIERWLKLIVLILLIAAIMYQWGQPIIILISIVLIWLIFSYWRANKTGYSRFVTDSNMALPEGELSTLPANKKITAYATGIFSVQDRDDFLLLYPAQYWQVPLGEHVMMVQIAGQQRYRYQFFNPTTLQRVQKGWLLFGKEPKPTLAITLLSEIGEAFVSQQNRYLFGRDKEIQGVKRTVYLSFADEAEETLVWHNIVRSARAARQ